MQKTVRNALLFLAGACLAVSVGLGIFLRPPLKSGVLPGTETPVLTCDGGSDYTLVILADESVPLNRLDPLVRMARKSGGTSHILRQELGKCPGSAGQLRFHCQHGNPLPFRRL